MKGDVVWVLALAPGPEPASAQETRTNRVSATVPSVGAVEAISPLALGERLTTGDLFVGGTVTTRHNGPYRLEVRLSEPFVTGGILSEVMTRTPSGALVPLGTSAWVTVASGPGGTGLVNEVEYLVVWGRTAAKNPRAAIQVPVVYRVVPF